MSSRDHVFLLYLPKTGIKTIKQNLALEIM